jgi:peptidyl-prolyl cis-trans isomerase D
MQIGVMEFAPGTVEGLAAYAPFRERAARVTENDFPELFELGDGGVAAIRLDGTVPPALQPYESVATQVAEDWRAARLAEALAARAAEAEAAIAAGASPGAFGIVDVITGLPRDGFVEDAPPALAGTAFGLPEGGVARVVEGSYAAVIRVDAILPADMAAPDAAMLTALLSGQMAQEAGQDIFALFARAVEGAADIRLDANAIAAVHATIQ